MLRLVVAAGLFLSAGEVPAMDVKDTVGWASPTAPTLSVPTRRVLTTGGDRLGYAPVARPYEGSRQLAGMLVSHDPVTGTDLVCGAVVLRSRSHSLVLTAAHCLYGNGHRYDRVAFLPAYNSDGTKQATLGVWPAVRVWVPKRWRARRYSTAQLPYDVGLVGVANGARQLEEVTGPGLRPYLTRKGDSMSRLELLGYPISGTYPGTDMYRCVGDATEGGAGGPGVLVTHNCHAAPGTSGGPALYDGAVAGVVSSSSPLRDPAGFTVMTRLTSRPFGKLLAAADRAMRPRTFTHRS
ncbi:trypsin-like serine protease [Nonomuraea sp. NPDC049152]|uniref:trypsin-like serine peptidase n=1 Tax=Nonomuraea sp. NPDC049152 TaxID=3154350 RepID=UPI0033F9D5F9